MGNKDKDKQDKEQTSDGASGNNVQSPCDAHHTIRDLSHEREATLNKQIVEAVARETVKVTAQFEALLNEKSTLSLAGSLKVTSGAAGLKVMDPFDWTKDKAIYQRWQMWSEKTRHTLEAMEGDSEKTKISYFHHWVDSEGTSQIESWKNNKTLLNRRTMINWKKLKEKASTL